MLAGIGFVCSSFSEKCRGSPEPATRMHNLEPQIVNLKFVLLLSV